MSGQQSNFTQGAVCGGLAAMSASACTHPLDLFKVRLQLSGELDGKHHASLFGTFKQMVKNEGIKGFYNGLSASLVRQALYSPARFGLFQTLMNNRIFSFASPASSSSASSPSSSPASNLEKLLASLVAGAFGGTLSSPADLVMVRMQADGRLSSSVQRKYGGIWHGLKAVASEGGLSGLFRGTAPNVQRAMITTATQFTSYDYFKDICLNTFRMKDGLGLHFTASLMAGVVVASFASPMDVVRTRMMNSKKAAAAAATAASSSSTTASIAIPSVASRPSVLAAPPSSIPTPVAARSLSTPAVSSTTSAPLTQVYARAYTSTFDCMIQTFKMEGPKGFYKGFIPYYARVGPQVTLMFVFYEQIQNAYIKLVK